MSELSLKIIVIDKALKLRKVAWRRKRIEVLKLYSDAFIDLEL
jgi:hypothetical protein